MSQLAERIALKYFPDTSQYGIGDLNKRRRENCLTAISEAELETMERCCRAMCKWCAKGLPLVEVNEVLINNGRGYWHQPSHTSSLKTMCAASPIRQQFEKER